MSIEKTPVKALAQKTDILFFFHPDKVNLIQTYEIEIKRLNNLITTYKKALNDLKDKADYIKHLEYFRDYLTISCIIDPNFRNKTILQCASDIENENCRFFNECKSRKELMKKLRFI